ncbi:MAG: hypothetical protein VYE46_00875 [Cyanobacteriota bacterium]|nr:hypothetical protein [Cyanobacteriota bacterium]
MEPAGGSVLPSRILDELMGLFERYLSVWIVLVSRARARMADEAVVPLMRRLGWAEGPASFFMSDWINADLVTHICPRV